MKKAYMTVDIGTSSVKLALFKEDTTLLKVYSKPYKMKADGSGRATLDPNKLYKLILEEVRDSIWTLKKDKFDLDFISFSSQMHSLMVVDAMGNPLSDLMTWADTRPIDYFKACSKEKKDKLHQMTGTPSHTMTWYFKLKWLKTHRPFLFEQTNKFIGIKEYILFNWLGEYYVDESIVSATGVWNRKTRQFDSTLLQELGLKESQLSQVVPVTERYLLRNREILQKIGLDKPLTLVIGASDGVLANIGLGAIDDSKLALSVGTSGALRIISNQRRETLESGLFSYVIDDAHYLIGGPINSGGMVLQWGIEQFFAKEKAQLDPSELFAYVFDQIEQEEIGSESLFFLPYLSGERAPIWQPNARGTFYGLGLNHSRQLMMRALVEGVNLNIALVKEKIVNDLGGFEEIYATGGFTKSPVWVQMLADTLNMPIQISATSEATSLGAVILGQVSLGYLSSMDEFKAKPIRTFQPISKNVRPYQDLLAKYKKVLDIVQQLY